MVHIAGLGLVIEGRHVRQRCAWCGLVLIEEDLALAEPGTIPSFWEIETLVKVDGNEQFRVEGTYTLPEDACCLAELRS